MHRPRGSTFKPALNGKRALVRVVGQFQKQPRGRVRQDERLADFKVFHHERFPLEQLRSGFERHLDEARGRKHDEILDAVVFQECHVPAIKPGDPRGGSPRQPEIEQPATTRCQTTFAHVAGLMPPSALVPGVGWKIEKPARRGDGRKIEHHTCQVQIHRRF